MIENQSVFSSYYAAYLAMSKTNPSIFWAINGSITLCLVLFLGLAKKRGGISREFFVVFTLLWIQTLPIFWNLYVFLEYQHGLRCLFIKLIEFIILVCWGIYIYKQKVRMITLWSIFFVSCLVYVKFIIIFPPSYGVADIKNGGIRTPSVARFRNVIGRVFGEPYEPCSISMKYIDKYYYFPPLIQFGDLMKYKESGSYTEIRNPYACVPNACVPMKDSDRSFPQVIILEPFAKNYDGLRRCGFELGILCEYGARYSASSIEELKIHINDKKYWESGKGIAEKDWKIELGELNDSAACLTRF